MIKYLKLIFALIIFGSLFLVVDLSELIAAFKNITWELAGLLLLISFVMIYISSIKWGIFLAATGIKATIGKLYKIYLLSYFVNLLLPSFVGGDIARTLLITDKQSRSKSLAATFMERLSGFIAMLILALLAMPLLPNLEPKIAFTLLTISLLLSAVIIFALKFNFKLIFPNKPFFQKLSPKLISFQDAVKMMFRKPKLLAGTLGLSFLFHCVTVLNTIAAALAVGWIDLPVMQLFVVLPIVLLISAIPLTPNGLGLQEGAFFYFLTMLGATPEEALGVGLILRAKSYLLALIGGLVFLNLKKNQPTVLSSSSPEEPLQE